jgi:hypothetical protein
MLIDFLTKISHSDAMTENLRKGLATNFDFTIEAGFNKLDKHG